jgi:nicotinamidase-related amidase
MTDHELEVPAPVDVRLLARRTALLVMDITDPNCTRRPNCMAGVPRIVALLQRARAAGLRVFHTTSITPNTFILPEVLPVEGEPVVQARADKFYGSDLETLLRTDDIETLLLVGTSANGAVLYTSFGATARGFTVVVVADGVSADTVAIERWSLWQVLNQPGLNNPANSPLAAGRVTLTTCDQVAFD